MRGPTSAAASSTRTNRVAELMPASDYIEASSLMLTAQAALQQLTKFEELFAQAGVPLSNFTNTFYGILYDTGIIPDTLSTSPYHPKTLKNLQDLKIPKNALARPFDYNNTTTSYLDFDIR